MIDVELEPLANTAVLSRLRLSGLSQDVIQLLAFSHHGRGRFPTDGDGMIDALFS